MEKTPEGFLLCRDVPISRTGVFDYSPIEAGIPPGEDGVAHLARLAEDLFSDATMASFEGKPVVVGHSTFVDPENWKQRTIGIVQNVRRDDDKLIADLLITSADGIRLVESNTMREVSCGYDATPIDEGGGYGHQVGIVGNHVALVQRGRCGSACKIRDGAMATNLKTILRRMFKDGDEEKFNEALDDLKIEKVEEKVEEKPDEKPKDAKPEKTVEERIAALEALVKGMIEKKVEDEAEKPEAEGEKPVADEDPKPESEVEEKTEEKTEEVKVEDEDAVEVKDEDARACMDEAEEVCPGMKKPTADSASGHFTVGTLKRVKRMALKGANVTAFGDSATLDGVALDTAFKAAVLMARAAKNPAPAKVQKFGDSSLKSRPSNAELNSLYNSFWKKA